MKSTDKNKVLDKVIKSLALLGIQKVDTNTPDRISVRITPREDIRYALHFYSVDDTLIIESFVFKAVSGSSEKQNLFLKTLLGYNAAVSPLAFAMVEISKGELGVVLRASVSADRLNSEELFNILNAYNTAYTIHVPNLRTLASELNLQFSGKKDYDLFGVIKEILNS